MMMKIVDWKASTPQSTMKTIVRMTMNMTTKKKFFRPVINKEGFDDK